MGDTAGDSTTDTEGALDTGRVIALEAVNSPGVVAFEVVGNDIFLLAGSFLVAVLAFLFLGIESFEIFDGYAVGGGVCNSGDNSTPVSLPYPVRYSISTSMLASVVQLCAGGVLTGCDYNMGL